MVFCIATGLLLPTPLETLPIRTKCGTTPLAKPTAATATAVSSSQTNLTWIDNSASETGYKIERKRLLGGTYSQIAQVVQTCKAIPIQPDLILTPNITTEPGYQWNT